MLVRGELITPPSDLFDPTVYNGLYTMHGTVMLFLFLFPMFSGAYFSQNQTNVIVETEDVFNRWIEDTVKKELQNGLNPAGRLYDKRLKNGNRGWATVEPAPLSLIHI